MIDLDEVLVVLYICKQVVKSGAKWIYKVNLRCIVLRGASLINLDAKGRLAIPTRYRQELRDSCDSQMVATIAVNELGIGEAGCLWLYPLHEWEKLETSISKLPTLNKTVIKLRRFLIGNAIETDMDGQGRLLLPENLRDVASMQKKIRLVGQLNKFEIWGEESWLAKQDQWMSGEDTVGLEDLADLNF